MPLFLISLRNCSQSGSIWNLGILGGGCNLSRFKAQYTSILASFSIRRKMRFVCCLSIWWGEQRRRSAPETHTNVSFLGCVPTCLEISPPKWAIAGNNVTGQEDTKHTSTGASLKEDEDYRKGQGNRLLRSALNIRCTMFACNA